MDAPRILGQARRILWRLKLDGVAIDPTAAAACTVNRHGPEGKRFAAAILKALGPGAGQVELDAAIQRALQGDKNPNGKAKP